MSRSHGHCSGGISTEYHIWRSMLKRCTKPQRRDWKSYGGRGIKVCLRWNKFSNFLEDMGLRPAGHFLERINNDGNYEPSNCRWASDFEQRRNKTNNRVLTLNGKTAILSDWAKSLGICIATLTDRLDRGWSVFDALTTPVRNSGRKRAKSMNRIDSFIETLLTDSPTAGPSGNAGADPHAMPDHGPVAQSEPAPLVNPGPHELYWWDGWED